MPTRQKIALVRGPTLSDPTTFLTCICPPIGLAYLKAVVERFDVDIAVVDSVGNYPHIRKIEVNDKYYGLQGQTAEELARDTPADADVILISIMFSSDWPYSRKVLAALRERCPKALIVAGGEHITACPEFSMTSAPEIDLCVLGEGEIVLENLLERYLENQALPEDVEGTCVRLKSGEFRRNARQARIKDLTTIPLPSWDGFPLKNYFDDGVSYGVNRGRSMPIMGSRGCPYQCTFCSNPLMWTTTWKARDPQEIVSEMKSYIAKYNVTNFDFYDLTTVVRKDWIVNFCKLMIAEDLNVTWQMPSGTRSEAIDDEVAGLLYKSGCRYFSYAPESGSKEMLDKIKKRVTIPRMLQSMKSVADAGLSVKANIIAGFPGENWGHFRETLWTIARIAWAGVNDLSIFQFSPYPGSELFEQLKNKGVIKMDDAYFEALTSQGSMTEARSYSEHLTNNDILVYKYLGSMLFYGISFIRRPFRFYRLIKNAIAHKEETRSDKVLNSYLSRFKVYKQTASL